MLIADRLGRSSGDVLAAIEIVTSVAAGEPQGISIRVRRADSFGQHRLQHVRRQPDPLGDSCQLPLPRIVCNRAGLLEGFRPGNQDGAMSDDITLCAPGIAQVRRHSGADTAKTGARGPSEPERTRTTPARETVARLVGIRCRKR
ncbi:hypothetical protein [Jatrophihabitans lederbergiae]|uniref:Uncharacterized protein n=1 Tax=Jatrophihabitans lederbergiae TaxID=3075547 RepID=A0ABU2JBT0_9ACTN|nr:hypothetical protein [Jatrophihabitans sp. DSM 44399]MDT0262441.1 hypothetical protein [Jatrophihabitans sp. DSM 44399]